MGNSSNDVAERAAAEAQASLGKQRFADALRQGSARDPATGTRLALAALDDVIDD